MLELEAPSTPEQRLAVTHRPLGDAWTIEPRGAGFVSRFRELWRYRYLLGYFAAQAIRSLYQRTYLGWSWMFIRPLFPMLIGTLVFSGLIGVDSGETPYFLFYLTGMAIWLLFEEGVIMATLSLRSGRRLLSKLYFPRLILPIAYLAPAAMHLLIYCTLLAGATMYFLAVDGKVYLAIGSPLLLTLAAIAMALVFALGIGLILAPMVGNHRDLRFGVRYSLRLWSYLTPIIYPITLIPEQWRPLAAINPMTTIAEMFKWGLFGKTDGFGFQYLAPTLIIMAVTLIAGLKLFTRAEAEAVDRL